MSSTHDRNLQIVADRQAGASYAMIAMRHSLSRRRAAQIVQQHGQHLQQVSRHPVYTRDRNLQIVADRQAGASYATIAMCHSLSRRRAAQIVQQHKQRLQQVSVHPVYQYLGRRAINCLRKDGVNLEDIDAISQYSRESLLLIPNFSHKSLAQLEAYLRLMGRALLGRGPYARAAPIPPAAGISR